MHGINKEAYENRLKMKLQAGAGNENWDTRYSTMTGWWYTYPSEKYESVGMMIIPNMMGQIIQMFQTTNHMISSNIFKPWLKSSRNTGGPPLHALGGVFSRGCGVFARGGVVARDGVFARGDVFARGGVFARVAPALRWANILCNLTTYRSNNTVILTSGFSFWSVRRENIRISDILSAPSKPSMSIYSCASVSVHFHLN